MRVAIAPRPLMPRTPRRSDGKAPHEAVIEPIDLVGNRHQHSALIAEGLLGVPSEREPVEAGDDNVATVDDEDLGVRVAELHDAKRGIVSAETDERLLRLPIAFG